MEKTLKITFENNGEKICQQQVEKYTQVSELLDKFNIPREKIFAVLINNELCPLDKKLTYNATIEPVLDDTKEGASVYRRSLCLLLAAAAHDVFPKTRLLVGHSLGHGYYYTLETGEPIEDKQITELGRKMSALVKQDIPILTDEISWQEAASLFDKLGLQETRTVRLQ